MKDRRCAPVLAAVFVLAFSGIASADRVDPSPSRQQTSSFLSWLGTWFTPAVAPRSQPATSKLVNRTAAAPPQPRPVSASLVADPQPACSSLSCMLMVGIGF
jgi:hypothetical protein